MTTALARAVAQWMVLNPGQRPEIRRLRHRAIELGETVEVRSDPPGIFAPDYFVVARAAADFAVFALSSTWDGVVVTVVNVSQTSMPRRFDGWLVGRDPALDRKRTC